MRLLIFIFFLTSCSPVYLMQVGVKQTSLILNRKPIEENNSHLKNKLNLIIETKKFIESKNLKSSGFNYYTIHDEPVSYLLIASKQDAFENYTWWYPIIGRVPYKGFITKESAIIAARELEKSGYETYISEVDAFSTLGWFDDPILSVALKRSDADLVNLIIHETVHENFWHKNEVSKNESIANFIGLRGALDFWSAKYKQCIYEKCSDLNLIKTNLSESQNNFLNSIQCSDNLQKLIDELTALYLTKENVLEKRELVIQKYQGQICIPKKVNNALLSLRQIYFSNLEKYNSEYKYNYKEFLNLQSN